MPEIEVSDVLSHLYRLGLAYLLAFPLAWNRERETRTAGLRTFPLVALASCGYMLVGTAVFEGEGAQSRVLYGITTGIGFIGGGAILKSEKGVHGVATAASIWNTGAIGIAVAMARFEIGIALSVVSLATLLLGSHLKGALGSDAEPEEGD